MLAAVVAAFAASLCCVLPLALVLLGVGGAWVSGLTALETYRPIFTVLALGCLGLAFFLVYRSRAFCDPACADPRRTRISRTLLWLITPLVIVLLAAPYVLPYVLAGQETDARSTPGELRQVVLDVEGMTCPVCPVTVRKSLTALNGVVGVEVTLEPPEAIVRYDPAKVSVEDFLQATKDAGYTSSIKQERSNGGKS
jgi:mercuric transport protein